MTANVKYCRFAVASLLILAIGMTAMFAAWAGNRQRVAFTFAWRSELCEIVFSAGTIRIDNQPQRTVVQELKSRRDRKLDSIASQLTDVLGQIDGSNSIQSREAEDAEYANLHQQFEAMRRTPVVPQLPPISYNLSLFPIWLSLVVISAGYLCTKANRFMVRRKWIRNGQCIRCGYDLRASELRCPECGTLIEPDKTKGSGVVY